MILPLLFWPDPVLRRVCAPVTAFDAALAALAKDMLETMYAAPGRGLAAPQIGDARRIFVMDPDWKTGTPAPLVCVNPAIVGASETRATRQEGCLSIPDTPRDVTRPVAITLTWQDPSGQVHRGDLTGFAATCAQHELDHLNGILILDHASATNTAKGAPDGA